MYKSRSSNNQQITAGYCQLECALKLAIARHKQEQEHQVVISAFSAAYMQASPVTTTSAPGMPGGQPQLIDPQL
jgi:hypothetical protein